MYRFLLITVTATTLVLGSAPPSEAGLGGLFAKVGKLFTKKATSTGTRVGSKAATAAGTRAAASAAQHTAGRVVASRLGAAGTRALGRLSAAHGQKFTQLAPLLARSPHKAAWMETVARYGDEAVDFLMNHKALVVAGTLGTAAVLSPDDFLATVGQVSSTAIDATGKYIVQPAVESAAQHVVGPALREAVQTWWLYPLLTSLVAAGLFGWKVLRWRRT